MYKGIIFDLDGTLLNTLETIAYYGNETLVKYGFEPISTEKYNVMVGNGVKNLIKRMLEHCGSDDDGIYERVLNDYNKSYNRDVLYKTVVFDGIKDLIADAKKAGMKLAVLSNKVHGATVDIIDNFFEKETFDVCYGAREGVPLKPNPAAALEVSEKLGINCSECIYVGDTDVDMKTGKNAGFYTVGVLWGFRGREELEKNGADMIASKPSDILKLLQEG